MCGCVSDVSGYHDVGNLLSNWPPTLPALLCSPSAPQEVGLCSGYWPAPTCLGPGRVLVGHERAEGAAQVCGP